MQHDKKRVRGGGGRLGAIIRVCAADELPAGSRRVVDINDYEEVLVLNVDGRIHALSNICPHQGAALERGPVTGNILYCPLHRWGFALSTGTYVDDPTICLRLYPTETSNGDLLLHLP
jgi:nitrite reductase (NADH) small subunit